MDRSTPWGNPFEVGKDGTAADCVRLYRILIVGKLLCLSAKASIEAQEGALRYVAEHVGELRGRDLACWCREGAACHGSVLLEAANGEARGREAGFLLRNAVEREMRLADAEAGDG